MSELKVYEMVDEKYCTDCVCVIPSEVYLKSEADQVIAELEMNLSEIQSQKMQLEDDVALLHHNNAELKKQVHDYAQGLYVIQARGEKESRHQKYKRCLVMAKWCASRSASWCLDPADDELHKSDFYDKWKLRWLELAKKFKEGT